MNSKPLNLLLIEDDDDHAFLIQETIQQIGPNVAQVQRAMSLTEGLAKCKQQDYNIVLLDLGLPESTGLDTLKNFFLEDNTKTVVVLTSQTDLEIGAKAINMGAEDYLPKDALTPTILSRSIRYAIERSMHRKDVAEKQKLLQGSLKEKEALLKEVYHRVKNNMQVISSLLKLQSHAVQDKGLKTLFDETRARVAAMSLVHERLYQSESLSRIELGKYTETLANSIFQNYVIDTGKIELELNAGEVYLPIDKAVPFGLILNELISNALKHGFPTDSTGGQKKGKVMISISMNSRSEIELIVHDSGAGLPANFALEKTTSMGMDLIRVLTQQLHGQIEYTSDAGTRVTLHIPLSETALHLIDDIPI